MRTLVLFALLLLPATPAAACPVCNSETGQEVRSELAGNHFGIAIAATLSPFALLGGIVALVHRGTPSSRRRR